MIDNILGLIVLVIVTAALIYIRKQKKSGAACIGCSSGSSCGKKQCNCHTEEK